MDGSCACDPRQRPRSRRYREFWQFGVEWINPTHPDPTKVLIEMAKSMLLDVDYEVHASVKRGLSYYTDHGFELTCPQLGAQKQIVGGGPYEGGVASPSVSTG